MAVLGTAMLAVPNVRAATAQASAGDPSHWAEAWYSPPLPPSAVWGCGQQRTFSHQSVRQVVRLEAAGARLVATEVASSVTGQIHIIDGGWST